ncbi:hypothetical protein N7508_009134 [Penicillium antarcticum]|uniref:uncharacterized protein n=1 Tax=Penicillium antarcticum TaxID=416450 RepID=UPI0023A5ADDC|nr:uncharacterized protein N7508_009134 [Penicillium antarcticum]KAJ5294313.1 hypothetical protein N7508_009134 [Penicillium antarcticum]
MAPVKLVWGGGSIMMEESYPTLESIDAALEILQANGVTSIDTARIYGTSEERLGQIKASSRFAIDTKHPGGFAPEANTQELIGSIANQSLKYLQTDQVDVYYIHAPDRRFPLEELLAGVNTLFQAGKFKSFGLSNYLATEVEEVVRVCREKGYVLPTVYQGNYSAVARRMEAELLPTLRKHNIAFNAYSPIAGGFLTKDAEILVSGGEGRWDPTSMFGGLYHALYNKKNMLEGLRLWDKISKEFGIPKAELAYRWVAYNSALSGEFEDRIIFGTRTIEQLNQTLAAFAKGPLDSKISEQIEQVWNIVEADAPLDNFNGRADKQ